MVKIEQTVVIALTKDEASKLMRFLVDGPDWESAPGGTVAQSIYFGLERNGITEA